MVLAAVRWFAIATLASVKVVAFMGLTRRLPARQAHLRVKSLSPPPAAADFSIARILRTDKAQVMTDCAAASFSTYRCMGLQTVSRTLPADKIFNFNL